MTDQAVASEPTVSADPDEPRPGETVRQWRARRDPKKLTPSEMRMLSAAMPLYEQWKTQALKVVASAAVMEQQHQDIIRRSAAADGQRIRARAEREGRQYGAILETADALKGLVVLTGQFVTDGRSTKRTSQWTLAVSIIVGLVVFATFIVTLIR